MLKEFRDFIAKGNVMDMAVGIIIGAAFTAIVTSLVGDIINPLLSIITGNTDFSANYIVLRGTAPEGASLEAAKEAGATVWAYGSFITAVINFLIIAFVVFLLVKGVNKIKETAMRKEEAQASAAGPSQEALLAEIRDLLAAQRGGVAVDPTLGAPRQYEPSPIAMTLAPASSASGVTASSPSASPTGGEASRPSWVASPARRCASSVAACRQPLSASATTNGSVALPSACVAVRATAPGMLATQ